MIAIIGGVEKTPYLVGSSSWVSIRNRLIFTERALIYSVPRSK